MDSRRCVAIIAMFLCAVLFTAGRHVCAQPAPNPNQQNANQPNTVDRLDKIVKADLVDGLMVCTLAIPIDMTGPNSSTEVMVTELGRPIVINFSRTATTGSRFSFSATGGEGDHACTDQISAAASSLTIRRAMITPAGQIQVQLVQSRTNFAPQPGMPAQQPANHVTVRVYRLENMVNGPNGAVRTLKTIFTASANSFPELCVSHREEINQYLGPIFKDYGFYHLIGIRPEMAFQAFADRYAIDPEIVKQVAAIIPRLDAERPEDRRSASSDLAALGKGGALALLHIDRSSLSPEQNARIDAALAPWQPYTPDEVSHELQGPAFLIDCLDCDDRDTRQLALGDLSKLTGKKIDFDIDAAKAQRMEATQKIRTQLTPPTTVPASQ